MANSSYSCIDFDKLPEKIAYKNISNSKTTSLNPLAKPLKKFITITKGFAFKGNDMIKEQKTNTYIFKVTDINEILDFNKMQCLPDTFYSNKKYSDYIIKENDIIMCVTGSIGKLCLIKSNKQMLLNQNSIIIRINNTKILNPEYLFLCLKSSYLLSTIDSNGLGMQFFNKQHLENLKIYIPSLEEQERTLPLVKAKIKILEDKIKELEEEKENVNLKNLIDRTFYEVLQIDKSKHMIDFYNHLISHNSILYSMNFDGLNDCLDFLTNTNYNIPMDLKNNFNVVKLNDLLEIPPQNGAATKKINNDNGEHYRIMVKNLSSYDENMKIHNLDYVSKDDFDNCLKEKTLQKNDILYSSCGGGCLGNMVINNTKLKAIIDTHVGYLRLKNKDDALFMYYYLTSYLGQQQIFRCITGTTNQITINPKKFAKILVPILDDATKELIIKKINDYKKEKFAIEEKISFIQSIIDNDLNKYILNGYSDDLFEIPKEGDE